MDTLHPEDPARVGPYRLVARLGAGGMGEVFLGQDIGGGQAAVKVIHLGHVADPDFRNRFAREIATARRIASPWTAGVLAADPHAPQPWLATTYVPGPDLDRVVAVTGPLPADTTTVLAARLARALDHLHAMDVVHRDVKPSNVLLAPDGPRLIDFGIARATDATKITSTGVVVGTPAFMSPEQALGDDVGFPSDVFSLAAVLTFAATGTGPFGRSTGNPVAMLRRVSAGEPDLSAVPTALREVIAPCLAKDPAARPTAAELAARLAPMDPGPDREWLPPVVGALVARSAPAPGRRRSRAFVAGAAVATAVAVLATIGVSAMMAADSSRPTDATAPPTGTAASRSTQAPARTFPANPAPPPPPAPLAGLIPAQVPGWTAAVSTTRNAAYDVPPPWTASSPSLLRGFETADGTATTMSGVALYQTADPSPCPDEERYTLAWAGISGSATADPAAAARELAELWTRSFEPENGSNPEAAYGAARPVAANGHAGSHVTAEVTVESGTCGSPRKVIHTVAVPDGKGQSVVWVLLAERDVPGAVTDADIERMIQTLRPAGLQQSCDPSRDPVGSWC
jgi:serine/threonine protein kinase